MSKSKALPIRQTPQVVLRFLQLQGQSVDNQLLEEDMAIIATIMSVGTAVFTVTFTLWLLKELFYGKK